MAYAMLVNTCIAWVAFFGLMKLLEYLLGSRLLSLIDRWNLSISLGYIRWQTKHFNPLILNVGTRYRDHWKPWFTAGAIIGGVSMAASLVLLIWNLAWMVRAFYTEYGRIYQVEDSRMMILTPIVPGVNVPMGQVLYLFVALLISGIVHELGHAFAAVVEKVRVQSFGMFIGFIYPGAFVEMSDEGLARLTPLQKLRVYCAGAWHNIVLALIAIFFMLTISFWLNPLYVHSSRGPFIVQLDPRSPLGPQFRTGDVITWVNDCQTSSTQDLQRCLIQLQSKIESNETFQAFSVRTAIEKGYLDCCDDEYQGTKQCFRSRDNRSYCMSVKDVIPTSPSCLTDNRSHAEGQCLYPVSLPGSAIIQVSMIRSNDQHVLAIFSGSPADLWYSLELSDYVPRLDFLPLDLPYVFERLLYYVASVSVGLALLNMSPVFFLDGEWAIKAFLDFFSPVTPEQASDRDNKVRLILWSVSLLFVANLTLSLGILVYKGGF